MNGIIFTNEPIIPGIYKMGIEEQQLAQTVRAGQFVHVRCGYGNDPLLRRPISVALVEDNIVYIMYQIKGKGTQWLSSQKSGSTLDILGPLGNSFEALWEKHWPLDEVWVVGGGIGVFPLLLLAQQWMVKTNIIAFLGFKNATFAPIWRSFLPYVKETILTTEDGSFGFKGFVTDMVKNALNRSKPSLIAGCGPISMLKTLSALASEYGVPCMVSLEERMGCGIGACLVCSCKIKGENGWHYRRVCADGPVFWGHEVEFKD